MELRVNWQRVSRRGPQRTLALLNRLVPGFGLYSISLDGFRDSRYIIKAKGLHGDVILSWR